MIVCEDGSEDTGKLKLEIAGFDSDAVDPSTNGGSHLRRRERGRVKDFGGVDVSKVRSMLDTGVRRRRKPNAAGKGRKKEFRLPDLRHLATAPEGYEDMMPGSPSSGGQASPVRTLTSLIRRGHL